MPLRSLCAVERLVADDVLQRLGRHRTLHLREQVEQAADGRIGRRAEQGNPGAQVAIVQPVRVDGERRVAQVPSKAIKA